MLSTSMFGSPKRQRIRSAIITGRLAAAVLIAVTILLTCLRMIADVHVNPTTSSNSGKENFRKISNNSERIVWFGYNPLHLPGQRPRQVMFLTGTLKNEVIFLPRNSDPIFLDRYGVRNPF